MSLAASIASANVRSPSMHASRRTENKHSRAFFAPEKAWAIVLNDNLYKASKKYGNSISLLEGKKHGLSNFLIYKTKKYRYPIDASRCSFSYKLIW